MKLLFKDVVMLAAVDWDFIAQAQQIFASYFSKYGINVIYVEPFPHRRPRFNEIGKVLTRINRCIRTHKKPKNISDNNIKNINIITPITLPETNWFFKYLNKKFFLLIIAKKIRKFCTSRPVLQSWTPYESCLEVSKLIKPELLIYSCVDDCLAFTNAPKHLETTEKIFLKISDIVVVKSSFLADRLMKVRSNLIMRDSAVEFEVFKTADNGPVTKVKRLCFFGAISDRLDFVLINELAEKNYKILLLGPFRATEINSKKLHPNIEWRPPVPYEDVPNHLKEIDAIMLPYKTENKFNKSMHLAKMYECFATGKPIISTPIACLEKYSDLVYFGISTADFVSILRNISKTENEEKYFRRIAIAREHSWPALFQQEIELMNQALKKKRKSNLI